MTQRVIARDRHEYGSGEACILPWGTPKRWLLLTLGLGAALLVSPGPSSQAGDGPRQHGQPATPARGGLNRDTRGLEALPDQRPAAPPGERWALLIGIQKYEHMPQLHYCGADMDRLARALVNHCGYDRQRVQLLSDEVKGSRNPSRSNIVIALRTFLQQAKPEDTVLLAFSGHGDLDPNGRCYLMPIDGDSSDQENLEQTGLRLELVHEFLDKCPARQKVVFIDACHSGGKAPDAPANRFDPTKAPAPGRGIVELFSCDAKQVSWEDEELKQGVFSYYLAQALGGAADLRGSGNRDGFITDDEICAFTSEEVTNYVRTKFHKDQSPLKRVTSSGRIILARRDEGVPPVDALAAAEIAQQFSLLQKNGAISQELLDSSRQWLGLDPAFGPNRSMHLLLNLAGQRVISERQFWALAQERALQIRSHLNAAQATGRRKVYLLSLGIDIYPNLPRWMQLSTAVEDARLLKEVIGPSSASPTLLINDQVTESAVRRSIRETAAKCRPGDVVLIGFSGLGSSLEEPGTRVLDSGWLLHRCRGIQSTLRPVGDESNVKHRGIERDVAVWGVHNPNDEVLSMGELDELIRDCRADVVVISDACYVFPRVWKEFADYSLLDSSKLSEMLLKRVSKEELMKQEGTRIFIGSRGTVIDDSTIHHGLLSFLIAQGLAGSADLETPRLAAGSTPGDQRARAPLPDGFVTLGELVAFVIRHRGELATLRNEEVTVWGQIVGDDPVLVRHYLPID